MSGLKCTFTAVIMTITPKSLSSPFENNTK